MSERLLPPEFTEMLDELARSYLTETDPMRGSGFGGGDDRWRSEREPLLDGVVGDGHIVDVGCANGYLLECLMLWGRERGLRLTPHGVDRSRPLIERARARLPQFAENLHVCDAWMWVPPRRYDYVYALYDCVPLEYLAEYLSRLFVGAVADGGRLIVGAYGSHSKGIRPYDVAGFLESHGWAVSGRSVGGSPAISQFAWTDKTTGAG